MNKKSGFMLVIISIVLMGYVIIFIGTAFSLRAITTKYVDSYSNVMVEEIDASVDAITNRYTSYAKTMAWNNYFRTIVSNEGRYSDGYFISLVSEYFKGYEEYMDIDDMLYISDKTGNYVTADGLVKTINNNEESLDLYDHFKNSDDEYEIMFGRLEEGDQSLKIFIFTKVYNTDDNFAGLISLTVDADVLKDLFAEYEESYGIHVDIIDEDGSSCLQERENIFEGPLSSKTDSEVNMKMTNYGYKATVYEGDYNLWLMVYDDSLGLANIYKNLIITILVMLGIVAFITIFALSVFMKQNHASLINISMINGMMALSDIYLSIHLLDLKKKKAYVLRADEKIQKIYDENIKNGLEEAWQQVMSELVKDDYKEGIHKFMDLDTLVPRLLGKKSISYEFDTLSSGMCRARFIVAEADEIEGATRVIFAVESIEDK